MAQTLKGTSREPSTSENKPPKQSVVIKEGAKVKRALKTTVATATFQESPLGIPKQINSLLEDNQTPSIALSANSATNRTQSSRCFLTKCHTELESLLDLIKKNYHQEIKNLWSDDSYTDLVIHIGEDFKRPLHKCIFAYRAFKLFSTLKAFARVEDVTKKDIIICEFDKKEPPLEQRLDQINLVEEKINYDLLISGLEIPIGLISPELFSNFLRQVYLDQDLVEEENKLNQQFIDWLKINQPSAIHTRVKYTLDHKESFKNIQPNFEEQTKSSSIEMLSNESKEMFEEDSKTRDAEKLTIVSQPTSALDDSSSCTLLTRTETFELITKSSQECLSSTPATRIDGQSETNPSCTRSDDNELSNSEVNSVSIPPYAPTTRTGLKPKTFTTPINMRSPRNSNQSTTTSSKLQVLKSDVKVDSKDKVISFGTTRACSNKIVAESIPIASKRSSLIGPSNDTAPESPSLTQQNVNNKNNAASNLTGKVSKLASITRAQPISLERSQSPATSVIKGSGRNFIAANKRLISQIEKKVITSNDQATCELEAEVSDTNSYILESLTHDNLVAQMDKLTLISQSKLAESLSRLFIDGNLADTLILTKDGKQINSHRCILAARSAYLAELISKENETLTLFTTVDSNGAAECKLKIDLSEFSYSTVFFAVIHIYSGFAKVPDDVDVEELIKLTHLLHITTLRHVCIHNLRMNYCHYFHKPCSTCVLGVLKTLPLAWRYDYTELYSKCLQWIGSHFASIFCLKEFSELKPHDLLEECYIATLSQLTPDNIIPKTIECQRLLKNLPRVKWAESVICLVGRQLEDFCHYVADNYEKILKSESFLNLAKNCWECEVLEENLLAAMNHLKPDSGCKTLIQLHVIECSIESYTEEARNVSDSFANLVLKMRKYCERYLLKDAAAVVHCSSWRHMNPSLQKRIKDQAIIATDFDEATKQLTPKPKLPSMCRVTNQQQSNSNTCSSSSNEGISSPSNRSTPETRIKSPSTTYLPPPKSKIAAARHVKVLK